MTIPKLNISASEITRYYLATKLNLSENTFRKRLRAMGINHSLKLSNKECQQVLWELGGIEVVFV